MDQMQYAVIKWTSDGNKLSIEHLRSIVEPKKPWNTYKVGDTGKAKYGKGEWECQILAIGPSRKSLQGPLNESLLKMDELEDNANNKTTGTGQDVPLKKGRVSTKQTEREKAVVEKTASANEVLALREMSSTRHVPVSAETNGNSAPTSTMNMRDIQHENTPTTNTNQINAAVVTTAIPACVNQGMGMQDSSHVLDACGTSYEQAACATTQSYNNVESTPWTMTGGFGSNTSYQDSWYSPNRNYTMISEVMGSAFGSLYGHETPATTPRQHAPYQYYNQTQCHSCCETVSALQRRVEVLEEEVRRKKKCRPEAKETEKPVDDSTLQGKEQYLNLIGNAATVSIAVHSLLTQVYTTEELLSCSVMGGQNVKGETKPGLDTKRRSLIEVALLEKFDTSLTIVRNIMRDRLKLIKRRHCENNDKN